MTKRIFLKRSASPSHYSLENPRGEDIGVKVAHLGANAHHHQWQFKLNKSSGENNVMFGSLTEQPLGTALINNSSFTVEAIFEGPGFNDLIITEQYNLWNDNTAKKEKVTKENMVKEFLLRQLQNYISKYSIQTHE